MKNKASRRAIQRGRIQPRRMGLLWRRTEMSRSGSRMTESRTDAYGYNDRNELVSATKNTEDTEYQYYYDDIGNRLSSLDLGTNRTYEANSLNQYTSISNAVGETFSPTFDLDMRPRQRRRVARRSEATEPRSGRKRPRNQTLVQTATGDWQVAYNGENRPVLWECGSTNIVMKFDRMGRRVEYVEMVSGVTNTHHRFVYDGYLCIQRLNALANNAAEISFVWDPTEVATRPLVFQRQGGWSFFYTHDGNKNVSEVVSFQQARGIPAHYEYAPFGTVTATTNATTITAFDVRTLNPFRFSSEYADDTLGLVYYNYRHYEPVMGRWMSRDPKRYEDNIFSYLANDSINIADWLGLEFNVKHHESSEVPFGGWKSPESSAETRMIKIVDISIVPSQEGCPRGCYRFAVVFPDVRVDVYYRDDYARIQCYPDEMEHVACYERWYEKLANIAKTAESMSCMSPSDINKALDNFDKQDSNAADECDKCTQELDAKGGRHGH